MGDKEHYHRDRERQCREMAAKAEDPAIRKAHEELAEFHAALISRAAAGAAGADLRSEA